MSVLLLATHASSACAPCSPILLPAVNVKCSHILAVQVRQVSQTCKVTVQQTLDHVDEQTISGKLTWVCMHLTSPKQLVFCSL